MPKMGGMDASPLAKLEQQVDPRDAAIVRRMGRAAAWYDALEEGAPATHTDGRAAAIQETRVYADI